MVLGSRSAMHILKITFFYVLYTILVKICEWAIKILLQKATKLPEIFPLMCIWEKKGLSSLATFLKGFFWNYFLPNNQHCFICHPSYSTVSEDDGIEPTAVATFALAARCSTHNFVCQISFKLCQIASTQDKISSKLCQISSTRGRISSTLGQISPTVCTL